MPCHVEIRVYSGDRITTTGPPRWLVIAKTYLRICFCVTIFGLLPEVELVRSRVNISGPSE
jgi:hypothetical protein